MFPHCAVGKVLKAGGLFCRLGLLVLSEELQILGQMYYCFAFCCQWISGSPNYIYIYNIYVFEALELEGLARYWLKGNIGLVLPSNGSKATVSHVRSLGSSVSRRRNSGELPCTPCSGRRRRVVCARSKRATVIEKLFFRNTRGAGHVW